MTKAQVINDQLARSAAVNCSALYIEVRVEKFVVLTSFLN